MSEIFAHLNCLIRLHNMNKKYDPWNEQSIAASNQSRKTTLLSLWNVYSIVSNQSWTQNSWFPTMGVGFSIFLYIFFLAKHGLRFLHRYGSSSECSSDGCLHVHLIGWLPFKGAKWKLLHLHPFCLHGSCIGRVVGRTSKSVLCCLYLRKTKRINLNSTQIIHEV
jgi:hypothetical protein